MSDDSMRRLLLVTLVIAVGATVVVGVGVRNEIVGVGSGKAGSVSLVGDSLNVGIEPFLPRELPRWRIDADDEVGRTTSVGIDVLRARRGSLSDVVVISLGTNDPADATSAFRSAVREALRLVGEHRCLVWVSIVRDGDAYAAFNDVLEDERRGSTRLVVVGWDGMVQAHPEWLTSDGVHATSEGYAARAEAVAGAVEECIRGVDRVG
jgi:hypothetical protein